MKQPVLIIVCIFLLSACSVYNRIHTSEASGLKKLSLIQTSEANPLKGKVGETTLPGLKINTTFLYEEIANARPLVTLDFKIEKTGNTLTDSTVLISLDNENIQLFSLNGRYVVPENLWVPIVHSQSIQYLLNMNHDWLVLRLNEKQKIQLIEYFTMAIQYRDSVFPAIPPGKKKW